MHTLVLLLLLQSLRETEELDQLKLIVDREPLAHIFEQEKERVWLLRYVWETLGLFSLLAYVWGGRGRGEGGDCSSYLVVTREIGEETLSGYWGMCKRLWLFPAY